MIDKNELKFYIEDLQSEDVTALLSVRLSANKNKTITGDRPTHIATVTCNPQDGWSDGDRWRIDCALSDIVKVLNKRYKPNT